MKLGGFCYLLPTAGHITSLGCIVGVYFRDCGIALGGRGSLGGWRDCCGCWGGGSLHCRQPGGGDAWRGKGLDWISRLFRDCLVSGWDGAWSDLDWQKAELDRWIGFHPYSVHPFLAGAWGQVRLPWPNLLILPTHGYYCSPSRAGWSTQRESGVGLIRRE